MSKGRFEKVIVIGCGKIAGTVLKYVAGLRENYGFCLQYVQHEIQEMTAVNKICEEYGIERILAPDRKILTERFLEIKENTLIISCLLYTSPSPRD